MSVQRPSVQFVQCVWWVQCPACSVCSVFPVRSVRSVSVVCPRSVTGHRYRSLVHREHESRLLQERMRTSRRVKKGHDESVAVVGQVVDRSVRTLAGDGLRGRIFGSLLRRLAGPVDRARFVRPLTRQLYQLPWLTCLLRSPLAARRTNHPGASLGASARAPAASSCAS